MSYTIPLSQGQAEMFSATGLIPCPFCGSVELSRVQYRFESGEITPLMFQCEGCAATGPVAETEEELRSKWDARVSIGRPS